MAPGPQWLPMTAPTSVTISGPGASGASWATKLVDVGGLGVEHGQRFERTGGGRPGRPGCAIAFVRVPQTAGLLHPAVADLDDRLDGRRSRPAAPSPRRSGRPGRRWSRVVEDAPHVGAVGQVAGAARPPRRGAAVPRRLVRRRPRSCPAPVRGRAGVDDGDGGRHRAWRAASCALCIVPDSEAETATRRRCHRPRIGQGAVGGLELPGEPVPRSRAARGRSGTAGPELRRGQVASVDQLVASEAHGERDDADARGRRPSAWGRSQAESVTRPDGHRSAQEDGSSTGPSSGGLVPVEGAVGWRSADAVAARRRRLERRCWIHHAASPSAAAMVTRMPRPDSAVDRTVMAIGGPSGASPSGRQQRGRDLEGAVGLGLHGDPEGRAVRG